MVLHLLHYDQVTGHQFASYVINQFSSPLLVSEFVIITETVNEIDIRPNEKVRIVRSSDEDSFLCLVESLGNYSAIVLHGLFYPWCERVLNSVPIGVKVAWMFWGGEIYDRDERFLAPITCTLNKIHLLIKGKAKSSSWQLPIEVFRRVDFCLTGEREEYEYAKDYLKSTNLRFIWYTYYSIEETLGELYDSRCQGNDVCFCNSAAVGNNCFDAIARFSLPGYKSHFKGRNIIMPLSYGSPWIRNAMLKIGSLVFGESFKPLVEFLPRAKYNNFLLNCSTMILPHYRPAGQGNILTALWLGMRVYLSERSLSYAFFKRLGISLFSLESDFKEYGCKSLSENEIQNNRNVLTEWYGKKHIIEACNDVITELK